MSSRKPGDVVLVKVPFTDLSQSKKRPALVLLPRGSDHLVAFLTSRVEQAGPDGEFNAYSDSNYRDTDDITNFLKEYD